MKQRFIPGAIILAISNIICRLLGLLRSSLLANAFGATESLDCYLAAFRIPDLISNIIVLGAVSTVLVPFFVTYLEKKEYNELHKLINALFQTLLLLMVFLAIVLYFASPKLVSDFLMAGYDRSHIELTVKLTRIMLLQPILMGLSSLFGAVLNSFKKYLVFSLASVSYNIAIILGIIFFVPNFAIYGVVCGVILGALIHLLLQLTAVLKQGFRFSRKFIPDKRILPILKIAFPRIMGSAVDQVNRFVYVSIASFLAVGSISIFEFSESISMVPFGLFANSLAITSLPVFSELYLRRDYAALNQALWQRIRIILHLMLPITIGVVFFARTIITLLFGYGQFNMEANIVSAANTLSWLMLGICFYAFVPLFVRYFYSYKNTVIPFIIGIISVGVMLCLQYFFSRSMGVAGLGVGRSIGYIFQCFCLFFTLVIFIYQKQKLNFLNSRNSRHSLQQIMKMFIALGVFILVLIILNDTVFNHFNDKTRFMILIKMFVLSAAGGLSYFLILYYLKSQDLKIFLNTIGLKFLVRY